MCPPDFYDTHFMLNPWMGWTEAVDHKFAARQWEELESGGGECGSYGGGCSSSSGGSRDGIHKGCAALDVPGVGLVACRRGAGGLIEPPIYRTWLAVVRPRRGHSAEELGWTVATS